MPYGRYGAGTDAPLERDPAAEEMITNLGAGPLDLSNPWHVWKRTRVPKTLTFEIKQRH